MGETRACTWICRAFKKRTDRILMVIGEIGKVKASVMTAKGGNERQSDVKHGTDQNIIHNRYMQLNFISQ